MMLRLREMLWEITPKCNKDCEYCGSKDIINKHQMSESDLIRVANNIAAYPPEEITITGGEPGMVKESTMNKVVDIFLKKEIVVKAVTNGKIIEYSNDVLSKFSIIGFSINTPEDVGNIDPKFDHHNHTMITNFGKHNIWDFDKLFECSKNFKYWQVQLTMGKELLNQDGIKHLRDKISDINSDSIVLADNLKEEFVCPAGICACSVTFNGDVVGCLSERSYGGIQNSYGNLLEKTLEEIWESEFKDCRFKCSRKCCRDHIKYPEKKTLPIEKGGVYLPPTTTKPSRPITVLYGVIGDPNKNDDRWEGPSGPITFVYGTHGP